MDLEGKQGPLRTHLLTPRTKPAGAYHREENLRLWTNILTMNTEPTGGDVSHSWLLSLSNLSISKKMELIGEAFSHSLSHPAIRDCKSPPYCSRGGQAQPLRSLKSAMLRSVLDNRYFFRPSADLVTIILTNEPERAGDKARADTDETVIQTFEDMFSHLSREKLFISFGFLILDQDCLMLERENSSSANFSPLIAKMAENTGGKNFSLCARDYNRSLENLSEHIRNSLENSIMLKERPLAGSLTLDFESPRLDWKIYGRKIVFKNRKKEEIRVSVSYEPL